MVTSSGWWMGKYKKDAGNLKVYHVPIKVYGEGSQFWNWRLTEQEGQDNYFSKYACCHTTFKTLEVVMNKTKSLCLFSFPVEFLVKGLECQGKPMVVERPWEAISDFEAESSTWSSLPTMLTSFLLNLLPPTPCSLYSFSKSLDSGRLSWPPPD